MKRGAGGRILREEIFITVRYYKSENRWYSLNTINFEEFGFDPLSAQTENAIIHGKKGSRSREICRGLDANVGQFVDK